MRLDIVRTLLNFIFLFTALPLLSQEMQSLPDSLAQHGRKILEAPEYEVRSKTNQWFWNRLEAYVQTEEGYNDDLEQVSNMMRLAGDKDRFRIFTWQMPDSSYKYQRYGLVVVKTKRGYVTTRLHDELDNLREAEFSILPPKKWPGAIYYKLLPEGQKDNKYTLLGLVLGEPVNRKIIEVIEVRDNGRVRFGGKLFRIEEFMDKTLRKPPMRLIMTYSSKYSVTVNWNAEEEKVIMDHLAPPDAKLKGLYRTYGPDLTYDALYWDDGWWHLESQINFNSGQDVNIVPPSKPTGLPAKGRKVPEQASPERERE